MKKNFYYGLVCLALAIIVVLLPTFWRQNDFFVNYIDVGQGDSILIGHDEHYALIDGGGNAMSVTNTGEYVVVPYLKSLGINHLDYCINTHPDADHIGGLFAVVDQLEVGNVVVYENYEENLLQKQFLSLAEYRNSPVTYVSRGDVLQLTDDVSIKILSPYQDAFYSEDDVNEGSLVMVVSYKDFDILLTGDVQGYEQIALTKGDNDLSDIDVLHIPHHGSKNSYNEKWYDAFDPDAVMISVGKDNSYGHPDPDIISYWQNRDVKVFRTDIDGSIKIEYDGKNIFYDTYVN